MTTSSGPVMANGQPNPTGTGRYCPPKVCYCGGCLYYVPLPSIGSRPTEPAPSSEQQRTSWENRTEATWIDSL